MSWALASRSGRSGRLAAAFALGLLGASSALAQATPPPVTLTQPGVPSSGEAVPTAPSSGIPSPGAPPAGPAQANALPTLVPQPGDTGDVDEVVLPSRPVAVVSGQSKWEDGLKTIRAAFGRINDALAASGISRAGRPITVFTETSDENFKFEAMMPVATAPGAGQPVLPPGTDIRLGTTPSGKAYRFVHKGPYDEIDSTYETITAYLDAKDIVAKDSFIEEYLNEVADPTDPSLEINIFVQPR